MERYKIHITFNEGSTHVEEHTIETLTGALERLTKGPAARMGMIKELKVVDMLDCVAMEWKNGRLIYPLEGVHF